MRADSAFRGFSLTATVLLTLLGVTLYSQLPVPSALPSLASEKSTFASIWPQGWGFFATEGDAVALTAYRPGEGGDMTSMTPPMMSQANAWGVGHTAIAAYDVAYSLAAMVPQKAWVSCPQVFARACLTKAPSVQLVNSFKPAILCGWLIFVENAPGQVPVTVESKARSGRVAKLDVRCPA